MKSTFVFVFFKQLFLYYFKEKTSPIIYFLLYLLFYIIFIIIFIILYGFVPYVMKYIIEEFKQEVI